LSLFDRLYRVARAHARRAFENRQGTGGENSRTWRDAGHRTHDGSSGHSDRREPPPRGPDQKIAEYYAALEVPVGSDLDTVKKAWKRLLRKYHPDLHAQNPEKRRIAQELSQGLNEAYAALERHLKSGR